MKLEQTKPQKQNVQLTIDFENAEFLTSTKGVLCLDNILSLVLHLCSTDLQLVLLTAVFLHVFHALC